MSSLSASDYIRWVKGSLNRLLGCVLSDDGHITPEYRVYTMLIQGNQHLPVTSRVDEATQNALMKLNRFHPDYVRWIQIALNVSGEGIGPGGGALATDGSWNAETEGAVKDFQTNQDGALVVDGFVGAKTETQLMEATGTTPPGRGTKAKPAPPGIWSRLLTVTDRISLHAAMYAEEIKGAASTPRNRQLACFADKFRYMTNDADYAFFSIVDVNHFLTVVVPPSAVPAQFIESHRKSNARQELVDRMTPIVTTRSSVAAYRAFGPVIEKLYERVQDGLDAIQYAYATNFRHAHDLRASLMHNWALSKQSRRFHIYSCFEEIDTGR